MQSTFLQTSRLSATRGVCTLEMRGVRAPRMPSAWFAGVVTGCPRPAGFRAFAAATDDATSVAPPVAGYQLPSQTVQDILDAPVPPSYAFSPDRKRILKIDRPGSYPPISDFMHPELKLGGLRVDPDISARSRMGHSLAISVVDYDPDQDAFVSDLPARSVTGLPNAAMVVSHIRWSPDGQRFSFTLRSAGGPGDPPREPLQLWLAHVDDLKARCLVTATRTSGLNAVLEDYVWLDNETLVTSEIPEGRGDIPKAPPIPVGPKISDNSTGKVSQARTYPDLLQNQHDEDVFEWLTTATLCIINVATGHREVLGLPRMYTECSPSPDGELMLVSWIERPFSYSLPAGRFPRVYEVWNRKNEVEHEVARLPLQDSIPIDFDATRTGPRSIDWRSDKPRMLTWAEAQDEGDPKKFPNCSPRDIVFGLDFETPDCAVSKIAQTDLRYGGIAWCDEDLALLYESEYKNRRSITWMISPGDLTKAPEMLFDRNYEDVYGDPGSPMYRRHPTLPTSIIAKMDGERRLLLTGSGASPEGNKPFMDTLDLGTRETKRIWQSAAPHFEAPASLLNKLTDAHVSLDDIQILFTRESQTEPPQFYVKHFAQGGSKWTERQLTNEPHPFPMLKDMQKEIIRYKRDDDVDLTATLHLPPGYDAERDGPLPGIMWAYPREFKSKDAAGQLNRSPHEFSGISGLSPLVWVSKGYAVLSGPSMPIIAEGEEEPNDTFVEQLVGSAQAAVAEVVRRGVMHPERIAIGGHSYGAFMTANILAHCGDLFACGIAQSGAYNRTLTPFGFQSEQRSFWQAPEVYSTMAPFNNADKIKTPILLVHGEADNNTGTFPMQSERFYSALQGHGCPARLVLLPHESHGYRAYESIMHVLSETETWLDTHTALAPSEDAAAAHASNGNGSNGANGSAAP